MSSVNELRRQEKGLLTVGSLAAAGTIAASMHNKKLLTNILFPITVGALSGYGHVRTKRWHKESEPAKLAFWQGFDKRAFEEGFDIGFRRFGAQKKTGADFGPEVAVTHNYTDAIQPSQDPIPSI